MRKIRRRRHEFNPRPLAQPPLCFAVTERFKRFGCVIGEGHQRRIAPRRDHFTRRRFTRAVVAHIRCTFAGCRRQRRRARWFHHSRRQVRREQLVLRQTSRPDRGDGFVRRRDFPCGPHTPRAACRQQLLQDEATAARRPTRDRGLSDIRQPAAVFGGLDISAFFVDYFKARAVLVWRGHHLPATTIDQTRTLTRLGAKHTICAVDRALPAGVRDWFAFVDGDHPIVVDAARRQTLHQHAKRHVTETLTSIPFGHRDAHAFMHSARASFTAILKTIMRGHGKRVQCPGQPRAGRGDLRYRLAINRQPRQRRKRLNGPSTHTGRVSRDKMEIIGHIRQQAFQFDRDHFRFELVGGHHDRFTCGLTRALHTIFHHIFGLFILRVDTRRQARTAHRFHRRLLNFHQRPRQRPRDHMHRDPNHQVQLPVGGPVRETFRTFGAVAREARDLDTRLVKLKDPFDRAIINKKFVVGADRDRVLTARFVTDR